MGFVNFMNRESAAKAINELDRVTWGGIFLRLSWGQPMPLPAKAIYGIGELSPWDEVHSKS
jgi:U2-associated protein SR140